MANNTLATRAYEALASYWKVYFIGTHTKQVEIDDELVDRGTSDSMLSVSDFYVDLVNTFAFLKIEQGSAGLFRYLLDEEGNQTLKYSVDITLSIIHISESMRLRRNPYDVFCLKIKNTFCL